jgi:hypothetical protein
VRRTLEAIFRHPLQLLMLIITLPILGVAVAYFTIPRTYQSSASVWALQRYFVIGATGAESDLTSTPAQTQATALTELLQTRSFALQIAQGIPLAPTLSLSDSVLNDKQLLGDALFSDISKHVLVTPSASNLFDITYANTNPKVAQQVVQAVITTFGMQSLKFSQTEAQNLLANYQVRLASAQKDASDAAATESQYIAAHPNVKLADDPEYALLESKRLQAQLNVQNIQTVVNQIEQSVSVQGSNVNTLFQVVDGAQMPDQALSRKKDYIIGGVIGLVVALLGCSLFLVVVVRRDRGVYSAPDLQNLVQYPVVLQLPKLTSSTISLLIPDSVKQFNLSEGSKNGVNSHATR